MAFGIDLNGRYVYGIPTFYFFFGLFSSYLDLITDAVGWLKNDVLRILICSGGVDSEFEKCVMGLSQVD